MLAARGADQQRRVLADCSLGFLDQMINVVTASAVACHALYAASAEIAVRRGIRRLLRAVALVLFGAFRFPCLLYHYPVERYSTETMVRNLPFLANMELWGALDIVIPCDT